MHEWTLVMYGTARNPYPKAFVQKYKIPKMDVEDEAEEEVVAPNSNQQQQQKSPPKIGKAPSVVGQQQQKLLLLINQITLFISKW